MGDTGTQAHTADKWAAVGQTVQPKCYFMRQRLLPQVTRSRRRARRWTCARGVRQICMRINTGKVDRNNIRR